MGGRRSWRDAEQPKSATTPRTRRMRAAAAPDKPFPTLSSMPRVRGAVSDPFIDADEGDDVAPLARQRAASSARPLIQPSEWDRREWETRETWSEGDGWDDADAGVDEDEDAPQSLQPLQSSQALSVRAPGAPALAQAHGAALAHPRIARQRLVNRVRGRWSLVRLGLAVAATVVALVAGFGQVGEPAQPFMALQARAASRGALNVAQQVKPLTSLKRPDQYDNATQFAIYSPAACSPSSMAEVLTAWGVPHATIGRMIDDLGSYLSPTWGLLDQKGFEAAAAKEGFRADISWHLTYNQLLYLTNVLGLPVIINVRRDWGYYHYLAGGHFLTVTGGDQQGVSIVDSSEYYITYLSRDVFFSLWQWRNDGSAQTVVLVPADYQYTIPAM